MTRISIFRLIAALAVFASLPAYSNGVDCMIAKTKLENMICSDTKMLELDSELDTVFTNVQQETAGINGDTGERIDPIGKEQQIWIKKVRDKCTDLACLRIIYKKRIDQIKKNWSAYLE
jgi:uncharacterized protein